MKRRLKETFAQAQAEMDVLYKTQADLLKGKEKLEQMMQNLEKEKVWRKYILYSFVPVCS